VKRICGYDLNGWRDSAVKSWLTLPGGEVDYSRNFDIKSGPLSSVVLTGSGESARWLGGAQVALAPHGKGVGWGQVGNIYRRLSFFDSLKSESCVPLTALIVGLSSGASHGVASLSDEFERDEFAQERILEGLAKSRVSSSLLVWRTVLAALYHTTISPDVSASKIGVICHSSTGFSIQTVRIRPYSLEDGATLLIPERRYAATHVESELGYLGLKNQARDVCKSRGLDIEIEQANWSTAISEMSMGEPIFAEAFKNSVGDWKLFATSQPLSPTTSKPLEIDTALFSDCEYVLFETLSGGAVRSAVESMIRRSIGSLRLVTLPSNSIREAAMTAALRFSEGIPVYFDFLPQISTIVQNVAGDAENFDLIDESETLAAGSVYRSKKPAQFGLQPGQSQISVYLRKENEDWPRKAVIELDAEIKESTPIELWTEQTPASGRAKIFLQAQILNTSYTVDWSSAEEIRKSWEQLIQELDRPLPTIPERLVLTAGSEPWNDFGRAPGLARLLDNQQGAWRWDELATQLSRRMKGNYAIDSDGNIPRGISESAVELLDLATEDALEEIRLRVGGGKVTKNDSLRFLTWQFKRCPEEVLDYLIDALESIPGEIRHPFISAHHSNIVLVYHALGRSANGKRIERRVLDVILSTPVESWAYRNETACLSFILSRSNTAPYLLTREEVELISKRVFIEFEDQLGGRYTKFNYAPLLMVGLLRWRLSSPRALVRGVDPIADQMYESVQATISDLESGGPSARSHTVKVRYLPILRAILEELEGVGTSSELLTTIFNVEKS